ncbi:MAG: PKD domain-containing protein, partial [Bacteroidetes bacterium]
LLSGNSFSVITKVYENKGNFSFEEMDYLLPGQWQGKTGWSDFDEDGDLDLIIAGTSGGYGGQSKLYRNDLNIPSAPVYSPSNLNSETIGYGILLSWKDSLNSGISYNVRVGSQTGFGDIVSPMADLNTGKRKVAVIGNADLNKSYRLDSLPVGTYFWSVQAINGAFKGGPWATEQSFTISVVNAAFSSDIVCNGDSTHFIDNTITSGESLISWKWYFSDGNTSSSENPVHLYANPGTYSVKLVVHSASYADSVTNIVVVKPTSSPDFTASIACQGTPTSLTNNTNANGLTILNWLWNFGDGLSSTLQNPGTHGYLNPGNYTAELWVFADNGCAASVQKTVTIGSYPVAVITANAPLTFCKGDSVTLSVPYNNTFIYTWKADGINITGADSSNYLSKLSGNYNVEVVNPVGTCKTISGTVAITAQNAPIPPLISAGGSLQFCQGDSVTLSVTNTTGYSYQWKLNGGAVGTNTNQYNAKASGTYSLFVSNSSGCMANSTNSVNVVVNSKPTLPTVNISGPTSFCQGGSIELSVTNNPGYTYQWENNGATISGASNNIYVAQNSGIYSLKILNSSGCDTKTENVTVNTLTAPASPEISAGSSLQFCQGDSVNLSVTNTTGYSYQWKLNGGAVGINSNQYNAKASGTYSLFVSNSSGCTANSTNSVNVVVNSLPSASAVSLSGPATFCSGGSIIMSIPSTAGYFYNWRNESGLISGANTNSYNANTSGKYQLDISNSSGCIVTTSVVNVVVKPVPLKPLIISENYQPGKCLGETPVKLKVSDIVSGYNYQWYMNRVPITNGSASLIEGFITQGDYAVEAEIDGCKVLSDSLKVYFENAPEKPLIYATGPTVWYLSCSNDSAMQYKWYYNGNLIQGADKYLYVANQKLGKYNVSISNTKGCFTVSDTLKIPLGGTGIADIDPFAGVKIYPNPTPGLFTIEMDNPIFGELKIDIFNQGGKEILNIKFEKTTEHFSSQINLKGQAKGVYIISLQINGQISNKKIIIE